MRTTVLPSSMLVSTEGSLMEVSLDIVCSKRNDRGELSLPTARYLPETRTHFVFLPDVTFNGIPHNNIKM